MYSIPPATWHSWKGQESFGLFVTGTTTHRHQASTDYLEMGWWGQLRNLTQDKTHGQRQQPLTSTWSVLLPFDEREGSSAPHPPTGQRSLALDLCVTTHTV